MTTEITRIDLTDELLDRWLERLKDPTTQRHERSLRSSSNPEAMCCLGHLCDLVDPDEWSGRFNCTWGGRSAFSPPIYRNGEKVQDQDLVVVNDGENRFPIAEIEALR